MKIYVMQAEGSLARLEGRQEVLCRKAFVNKESAELYKPQFRKDCVTPKDDLDLFVLDGDSPIMIKIGELELVQ
jgi:hypothetical protein